MGRVPGGSENDKFLSYGERELPTKFGDDRTKIAILILLGITYSTLRSVGTPECCKNSIIFKPIGKRNFHSNLLRIA